MLLTAALALPACGDDGGGTFRDKDFAITFDYPEGFERAGGVEARRPLGSRARDTEAVALDEGNGIVVQRYALESDVSKGNLRVARIEFDALVQRAAGRPVEGRRLEIDGRPALQYEFELAGEGNRSSRLIAVFDGDDEYLLNCQSTRDRRREVDEACDLAQRTLMVD